MTDRDKYLRAISLRGGRYGGNGGLLDLLNWCGKTGVRDVTESEARIFLEKIDGEPSLRPGDEGENRRK